MPEEKLSWQRGQAKSRVGDHGIVNTWRWGVGWGRVGLGRREIGVRRQKVAGGQCKAARIGPRGVR